MNETFIIHEGRLVTVEQITSVFPFMLRFILVGSQSNICCCQLRIMLHSSIMNEWGLLLCHHLRATAAGRHWQGVSTKPWPKCCLHISISFSTSFWIQPLFVCWHLHGMPFAVHTHMSMSARIKRNHSLRTQACKCHLSICVYVNVCVCVWLNVCVLSLALSCHFTCHPAISLGSLFWHWMGGGRCRVLGYITALAALHLTNGLLLSTCDGAWG